MPKARLQRAVVVESPAEVLHVEAERLLEGNRILDVPAVSRHARAEARAVRHGHAVVRPVDDVQAPRVVEVVLGAGADDGRLRLAVDVDPLVAFAEPAGLRLDDAEHRSGVEAPALHVEERVDLLLGFRRQLLLVARVEVERVGRQRGHLRPVDVVVDVVEAAAALVRQRDLAGFREGHRPVGVARTAVGGRPDHLGLDPSLEAVADGEKVADRRIDRGLRIAVVVDAQAERAAATRTRWRRSSARCA